MRFSDCIFCEISFKCPSVAAIMRRKSAPRKTLTSRIKINNREFSPYTYFYKDGFSVFIGNEKDIRSTTPPSTSLLLIISDGEKTASELIFYGQLRAFSEVEFLDWCRYNLNVGTNRCRAYNNSMEEYSKKIVRCRNYYVVNEGWYTEQIYRMFSIRTKSDYISISIRQMFLFSISSTGHICFKEDVSTQLEPAHILKLFAAVLRIEESLSNEETEKRLTRFFDIFGLAVKVVLT